MSTDLSARADHRVLEFRVADLSLAEAGRHQIRLAENEMPGLMALREEFGPHQPLAGARIAGSLHMTVQTAVLIETLVALGAQVRWASCNIFSTQDEAAAAVAVGPTGSMDAPAGVPVFAWKGETLEEYWACTDRIFDWSGRRLRRPEPHPRRRRRRDPPRAPGRGFRGGRHRSGCRRRRPARVPRRPGHAAREPRMRSAALDADRRELIGVTEETTTGVHRLYELAASGELLFPGINVNDSVTKSKFDNNYGIRHSLPDGLNRATDVLIGGKTAFVVGYGDVGKGAAEALRGQGARVIVGEIDPICALQAAMDGFQVARLDAVIGDVDIVITGTGNTHVVTIDHLLGSQAPRDRRQRRALRRRDRHGGARGARRRRGGRDQAAGARVAPAERTQRPRAQRGPSHEPRQRDRASVVRDERVVHEPGARPARAVHPTSTRTRSASTRCPRRSMRRSRVCTWARWASS